MDDRSHHLVDACLSSPRNRSTFVTKKQSRNCGDGRPEIVKLATFHTSTAGRHATKKVIIVVCRHIHRLVFDGSFFLHIYFFPLGGEAKSNQLSRHWRRYIIYRETPTERTRTTNDKRGAVNKQSTASINKRPTY